MRADSSSDPPSVKVCFALEGDNDWPPTKTESVWAKPVGNDEYELESVPWFARGVAFGDRVRAERDLDDVLVVRDRVAWSGRYTIRVIPSGDAPAREQLQEIVDAFSPLGAECEGGLPAFKIVALDLPPTARLAEIKALLRQCEADGRWEWEEGCIDDRWEALP